MAERQPPWRGLTVTRGQFLRRLFLAETLPVVLALPFALVFFLVTVPYTAGQWRGYVAILAALLLVTRVPNHIVVTRFLVAPILRWIHLRRGGRPSSQVELSRLYVEMTRVVPRMQLWAAALWAVSGAVAVGCIWAWMLEGYAGLLALLFTTLTAAALALCFSYFTFEWLARPFIEEVASQLEVLPDRGVPRVGLRAKFGGSVFGLALLAFLVFGILVWVKARAVFEEFALESSHAVALDLAARLGTSAGAGEAGPLLRSATTAERLFLLLDAKGEVADPANAGAYDPAFRRAAGASAGPGGYLPLETRTGPVRLYPVAGKGGWLVLAAHSARIGAGVASLLRMTALFLVCILLLLGAYIFWMTQDIVRMVKITARYNRRLSEGDLREVPSVWADDELGAMADDLRVTFRGLLRLAREIRGATTSVETEAAMVSATSESLYSSVAEQSALAEETDQYARDSERSMAEVSEAMRQVAAATQDVSATILQMQANVEEIAGTAEVLRDSAETSVSSANEIAATAEQVRAAADQLQSGGQDAVAYLTELDASLGETREGSAELTRLATKVTALAEGGFTSVAAVEEEIIRTLRVSEESHRSLEELRGSIENIGRILDVIQDISDQTNLLSLNASIIAAGAGEHGRAFGVVAGQIRELSSRTKGRAREIQQVVGSIQRGGAEIAGAMTRVFGMVEKSSDLSRAAGASLRSILESASAQEEMTRRIAGAADELAHGGQSASRTMHQIFERIESISRSVEEQARSTQRLTVEAGRVRDVVLQLRHATGEQARGAQMIAASAASITQDSQATAETVGAQAGRARSTAEAMRDLARRAQAIHASFEALAQASSRLRQSAAALDREVRNFKIPEACPAGEAGLGGTW